ncbi:MAG: hypothetical protein QG583_175 [Patescibacteria group bacterium]|nr:hypothetical protein [Patescibacteria group bacterium]
MKLQILFKDKQKGFTLIEMMIVIGIISIVGGLGLYFGFDSYRGYSAHSNRDLLVSTLQHARSQSISNVCFGNSSNPCEDGKPHGVKILNDKYIIFQGSSFTSRDEDYDAEIEINPNTTYSGMNEIVFAQLSGDISTAGDITLTDTTGRISTISINNEGQVIWTN